MNQNLPVSTRNILWPTEQDVTIKTMYTGWILLQKGLWQEVLGAISCLPHATTIGPLNKSKIITTQIFKYL